MPSAPSDREQAPLPLRVAMCTYQGERWLAAQLASIAQQTLLPDELVVGDDGSTDGTRDVLARFAAAAPFPVRLLPSGGRLGVVRNFERTLAAAGAGCVALADQDDVWAPTRLAAGVAALRQAQARVGSDAPVLVHSDMQVIDATGAVVEPSFFARRGFRRAHPEPLRELVLQNYVTGCSVLLNAPAVALALPIPASVSIHDWWLALVAAAAGVVVTLSEPTVGYRTHDRNVIGVKRVEWRPYMRAATARPLFARALRESTALELRLAERGVEGPGRGFLRRYHERVRRGGMRAALALFADGVRLQNVLPTLAYYRQVLARAVPVE